MFVQNYFAFLWEKVNINDLLIYIPGKFSESGQYKRISSKEILPYDYNWQREFVQ